MTTLGEIAKRNEDICRMYNAGGKTQKEVAKIFGVSSATVSVAIKNHRKQQAENMKRQKESIDEYEQLKAYLKRKWDFSEDDIFDCLQVARGFGITGYADVRVAINDWMNSSYAYFDDYFRDV